MCLDCNIAKPDSTWVVDHKQSFYSRILLCNELINDLHLSAVSVLWLSGVAACTQLLLVL